MGPQRTMNKISEKHAGDFVGSSINKIDSKNRVCIPSDFMETLQTYYKDEGDVLMVFITLDFCIGVAPPSSYWQLLRRLGEDEYDPLNHELRGLLSVIRGNTYKVQLDNQNRIRLKDDLLMMTGIKKSEESRVSSAKGRKGSSNPEVYIKGQGNIIEIWDKDKWQEHCIQNFTRFGSGTGKVSRTQNTEKGGD